jgi:hypothetical protein
MARRRLQDRASGGRHLDSRVARHGLRPALGRDRDEVLRFGVRDPAGKGAGEKGAGAPCAKTALRSHDDVAAPAVLRVQVWPPGSGCLLQNQRLPLVVD